MSTEPTTEPAPPSSHRELVVCAVFLAQLCLPGLIQLVLGGVGGRATRVENRAPAPAPTMPQSLEALRTFPARFQAHFDDTIVLRSRFVPIHHRVLLHVFKVDPHPNFLLGKEGWLFYTGQRVIEGRRGLDPLPAPALERWRDVLVRRKRRLAKLGIPYVIGIPPTKPAIYPELLPDWAKPVGPSRLAGWLAVMEAAGLSPLDLAPPVRATKARERVFFPYGTHWNDAGAFAGYRALHTRLRQQLPTLGPALTRASLATGTAPGETVGMQLMLPELTLPCQTLRPTTPQRANRPRMILYGDSFSHAPLKFLEVDFEVESQSFANELNWPAIERNPPAIVVLLVLERNLISVPR